MSSTDTTYDNGAVFTSQGLLFAEGSHSYRFEFQDLDGNVVRYPATGVKNFTVQPNPNASLYFAEPDSDSDDLVIRSENPDYVLSWTSSFIDGPDSVSFYYDTDRNPDNGMICIATGLPITGQMTWNTSTGGVSPGSACGPPPPDGSYYIYGTLASGRDDHLSPGRLTIKETPLTDCLRPWEYPDVPSTAWGYPDIAVGAQNVLHLVWVENDGSVDQIWHSRSKDGGIRWSVPVQISNAVNWSAEPAIAAWQDRVVVAFNQNNDGRSRVYANFSHDNGASWRGVQLVSDELVGVDEPEVASFSDGAHIVWGDSDSSGYHVYYRGTPDFGVAWCSRQEVVSGDIDDTVVVEADSFGVHVVYEKGGAVAENPGLYHVRGSMCGSFGSPTLVVGGAGSNNANWQRLASGACGLHMVFRQFSNIYHTRSTDGGTTWRPPTQITFRSEGNSRTMPDAFCVGQNVQVVLVRTVGGNAEAILFVESVDCGETWCRPQRLISSQRHPRIVVDTVGITHVVGPPRNTPTGSYARTKLAALNEPDNNGGTADTFYTVRWTLSSQDMPIDVYYDTNQDPSDGRSEIEQAVTGRNSSSWQTADLPDEGEYFICVEIAAGQAYPDPVTVYGPEPVTIDHPNIPPTLAELPDVTVLEDSTAEDAIDLDRFGDDAETPDPLVYVKESGPSWVTIDAGNNVDAHPPPNEYGNWSVTIRAHDADPNDPEVSDPATFAVTVLELPESVLVSPTYLATLVTGLPQTLEAITTDGTDTDYAWTSLTPAVATVAGNSPTATVTPVDVGVAEIQAEGNSTRALGSATVVVLPSPPVVGNPTATTLDVSLAAANRGSTAEFAIYCAELAKYVHSTGSLVDNPFWQAGGNWGTVAVQGLTPGTTYSFVVTGRRGSDETPFGPSSSGTTACPLPSITRQPQPQTVCAGGDVEFSIAATGTGQLHYQWYKNGVSVGPDSSTLGLTDMDPSDDGTQITCDVSDDCGTTGSDPATLTVSVGPRISRQPRDQAACEGGDAEFMIRAIGTGMLHYQWQKDTDLVGTDSDTLSLTNVQLSDDGAQITCGVTDDCGTTDSDNATLTVGDSVTWYRDGDGDEFGDPSRWITQCDQPAGYVQNDEDCNDNDNTVYLGAPEMCDGKDNDCDGVVPPNEIDDDEDEFSECAGDCDDTNATIHPGAPEVCDGIDNDCDGQIDPPRPTWCLDADNDGYGDPGDSKQQCNQPNRYVADCTDCDDSDSGVNPGATEVCNGLDDNCDGTVPANETDDDGDGFRVCDGDCDDADDTVYPSAPELCADGLDNDCDGLMDCDDAAECAGDLACVSILTVSISGPGTLSATAEGRPVPIVLGEPITLPKGQRVNLKAEKTDDCDVFVGWVGSVESSEPEIEVNMTQDVSLTGVFTDREWIQPFCGAGSCQLMAVGLLGLALMRRRRWM